jgi:hypothetical protein
VKEDLSVRWIKGMHDTLVKRREGGQWLDREEWQLGIRRCVININKPVPIYSIRYI